MTKYTLENGLKVVLNRMPYMKSVSIGIYIKSGSAHETKENNGIAHFIEHMLFKGTGTRSSSRISEESDELGGTLNAYTAEECTCVYIKVLSAWTKQAFDLVDDIVSDPIFDALAIENEKKVILEEITSADDNPEDAAQEMLMSNMFVTSSIGMPVLGKIETVNSFNENLLRGFYEAHYTSDNMVLSISGNFDESEIKTVIEGSRLSKKRPSKHITQKHTVPVEIFGGKYLGNRDIGQVQLVAGYPCVSRHDELLYPFIVLSGILGGDSSSRFFRRLREENGLVYNVDATVLEYESTGVFVISTSFSGENTELVCKMLRDEINDVLKNGVTNDELERAKRNITSLLELEEEGTMSVMSMQGKRVLYGIDLDSEKIRENYMRVTNDDIISVAQIAFSDKTKEAVAVIGDIKNSVRFSIIA